MTGTTHKKSPGKASKAKGSKLDNLKKAGQSSGGEQEPKKNGRGGKREGAGRKKISDSEVAEKIKEDLNFFILEEDTIQIIDKKTGKVREMTANKNTILLMQLYKEGMKGNVVAIKEYFERTMGKAKQPIDLSGTIKTEEQFVPEHDEAIEAALNAFYKTKHKKR